MEEEQELIMLPGPTNVPPRVMRAMVKPIINHRGPKFRKFYRELIQDLKYVFQTEGDVFPLTSSGTGGVECAVSNIISDGDKVVVPVNGVFSARLAQTVKAFGGEAIEIPVEWGDAATPLQIREALDREKDVKAVAVVYNETSTGVTMRCLKEVGELCDKKGCLFVVDAISILGGDELPVDEWKVDVCVAGSQKCLMAPPGLAAVSVSEKAWEAIKRGKRRFYFDLLKYKEFLERLETPYTPALPLFFALKEALEMIKEEGLEARFRRHASCAKAVYGALGRMNLTFYAKEKVRSNVVIAVNNPPKINDEEIRAKLLREHKVAVAGGMGKLKGAMFRIGVMGMVNASHIIRTVSALEHALKELGHEFEFGEATLTAKRILEEEKLL